MPPSKRARDNDEFETRKRERQARISGRVTSLTSEATVAFLDTVCRRWHLIDHAPPTYQEVVETAFDNFGLVLNGDIDLADAGSFGLRAIDEKIHEQEIEMIAVYHKLREDKALDDTTTRRVMACLEKIYYAKRLVLNAFQGQLCLHQMQSADATDLALDEHHEKMMGSWSLRFRWIEGEMVPVQKLLLHMLDRAMERKYRRQGEWCYEPVLVDGLDTHAWRPVMTIKDWVYRETQKEVNWEQWQWLTASGGTTRSVVEYLSNCSDYSFPTLYKDRTTFAFANGVYRARDNEWHPHAGSQLPGAIAACKYFDMDFPDELVRAQAAADIPTPHLDSIMDYQGWEPEVKKWLYILMGRLLYNLNDLDSWQVIPFFKGMASSGKSTLTLKVAKQFYEDIDVGCLSNNVEKKFGLSQFVDKLLFVAPEIKADLQIEQAEFQSIVSGESITINQKYKTAYSAEWKVPGVLAGNEVPAWCDNSGSIQRRIILFDFSKQVTSGDMRLGDKLQLELPAILLKSNRMYLEAVAKWSCTNIWTVLPRYFMQTRDEMAQATNVLEAFLSSEDVVVRDGVWCGMDDFKVAVKMYAAQNNFTVKRFTAEFFRGPLEKFGISRVRDAREHQGKRVLRDFLVGVDLAATCVDNALA
jgi:hypothetical protein